MLTNKLIDRICALVLAGTLLLTVLFVAAAAAGVIQGQSGIGYEARLFDQSRVHTIDIVMDDWEGFLETCASEKYSSCTVVIDNEKYSNIGIRGKGNTSLSSVAAYGNDRYSFKLEFDQYTAGKSYYGLDKLSLNNMIQDYTYLKDYMAYTLMNEMGVAAPLCSFVYITVNGEDWGLYLAVEAVEDSFLERNYGKDYGELYKPDSMSFGGGRGNGKGFDMSEFSDQLSADGTQATDAASSQMTMPSMGEMPEGFDPSNMPSGDFDPSKMPNMGEMPEGMTPPDGDGGGFGGMGSNDVRLQYINDDPDSYANIFNNAKTDITDADKTRLIQSLKTLSQGENIESVVDAEAVIRYLVVHNFMCNDDSYTGMMVHNYYLYEEDGVMSMIPWDYNLSIGAFSMGSGSDAVATSTVNSPIDSPVAMGDVSSRPMIAWIFENEEYTALYHEVYQEFIEKFSGGGWFSNTLTSVIDMISPYVEKDPTAFCTYEEFETATDSLVEFCLLRCESISGQLAGTIPSTTDGQSADSTSLIDASHIKLNDMGEFGMGGGGFGGMPDRGSFPERGMSGAQSETEEATSTSSEAPKNESAQVNQTQSASIPSSGRVPSASDFPALQSASGSSSGTSASSWLMLALCAAALIIGICVARNFKSHN